MEAKELRMDDVFKTLNERIRDYQYQPRDEERRELAMCFAWKLLGEGVGGSLGGTGVYAATMINPLRKLKAFRLGLAVGGSLYGSMVGKQLAELRCLHRLTRLPSPMGGEVEAIIRELDPEHTLIRPGIGDGALPSRLEGDPNARIASDEARMAQATSDPHMAASPKSMQGHGEAATESTPGRPLHNMTNSQSAGVHEPARNRDPASQPGTSDIFGRDIFDDSLFDFGGLPMDTTPAVPSKDGPTGGQQNRHRGRRQERRRASFNRDP